MAHCYDIPNVYYKRHAKFTKLVYGSIYRSVFIEEILENDKYDTVAVFPQENYVVSVLAVLRLP